MRIFIVLATGTETCRIWYRYLARRWGQNMDQRRLVKVKYISRYQKRPKGWRRVTLFPYKWAGDAKVLSGTSKMAYTTYKCKQFCKQWIAGTFFLTKELNIFMGIQQGNQYPEFVSVWTSKPSIKQSKDRRLSSVLWTDSPYPYDAGSDSLRLTDRHAPSEK